MEDCADVTVDKLHCNGLEDHSPTFCSTYRHLGADKLGTATKRPSLLSSGARAQPQWVGPSSKLEQTNFPGHGDSALKPDEQQAFRHRQTITQAFKRCPRKIRVSRNDGNFKQKGSLQAHQRWECRCIRGQQDGKGQQVTRPSSQRATGRSSHRQLKRAAVPMMGNHRDSQAT